MKTAASINTNGDLRIAEVDKVIGDEADQPAIVTVKVPKSLEWIYMLLYSEKGKLHVLSYTGKVSLFDPSTEDLILLEAP